MATVKKLRIFPIATPTFFPAQIDQHIMQLEQYASDKNDSVKQLERRTLKRASDNTREEIKNNF